MNSSIATADNGTHSPMYISSGEVLQKLRIKHIAHININNNILPVMQKSKRVLTSKLKLFRGVISSNYIQRNITAHIKKYKPY